MPPPHYRSHVHSGCLVSRKPVASTSLLLWLFVTILPLVQAGAHPWDLASLLFGNFISRFQSSRLLLLGLAQRGLSSQYALRRHLGESREISPAWLLKVLEPTNGARRAVSAPLAVVYLHLPCHFTRSGFGVFSRKCSRL